MEAFDKLIEKLPDIYFDWYARLLPGIAGMGAFIATATSEETEFWMDHIGTAVICGYVAGHFIQPPASFFARFFERKFALRSFTGTLEEREKLLEKREEEIADAVAEHPELWSKASKAHAESVSMFAAAILVCSALLIRSRILFSGEAAWAFFLLLVFGLERARACERKVRRVAVVAENLNKRKNAATEHEERGTTTCVDS